MAQGLRIVHYVNQFFGGLGGEDKASETPQVKEGPVGPGKAIQIAMKDRGEVVATVICGDNYFAETMDEAIKAIIQMLSSYRPDVVVAGPAFNAGRYGVACGALCKAIQEKLGVQAVTGMYEENPGVGLYRKDVYIVKTEESVKGMTNAVSTMVNLAFKLALKKDIGGPDDEGYFARGILKRGFSERTVAQRVTDMLLAKLHGTPFETELRLPEFEPVKPAPGIKDLSSSRICLVTDGGLVPRGNPDNIETYKATKYGKYSIKAADRLNPEDFEVVHVG